MVYDESNGDSPKDSSNNGSGSGLDLLEDMKNRSKAKPIASFKVKSRALQMGIDDKTVLPL